MDSAPFPLLYEISARHWLTRLGRAPGRRATLDDVPDAALDDLAARGVDWLWLLGVWQVGPAGRAVSRALVEHRESLPDLSDDDICGSPFAVQDYRGAGEFGGDAALARLRGRLNARSIRLMLDFVPNHTAPDHPWVRTHPHYYVRGDEKDRTRAPHNYGVVETERGPLVLAYGRDPNFPGWSDTFQLDYRHPSVRAAMAGELARVAARCDGVRCDMAMLVLPEVFARTWADAPPPLDGIAPEVAPFWPDAIARARAANPEFRLLAEAYWDLEWELQKQGFDATYDKRLYDRLLSRDAEAVRGHLRADPEFQRRSLRFLENHDEPRAAAAFPPALRRAAAVIALFVPGSCLLHDGQLEGRTLRASIHLARRPDEPDDPALSAFYGGLLAIRDRPEPRSGSWRLLDVLPAWEGNPTASQFVAFAWDGPGPRQLVVVVNYGPAEGQCRVALPIAAGESAESTFRDLTGPAVYRRASADLAARGLYLDMPPWGYHLFAVRDSDKLD